MKLREYIYDLEKEYVHMKEKGVRTIDIGCIINDLMRVRLSKFE